MSPADRRPLPGFSRLLLAVCAGVVLTACSGSAPRAAPAPRAADLVARLAVAGTVCAGLAPLGGSNQFTVDASQCSIGNVTIDIVTFRSTITRDAYLTATKGLGGSFLVGDGWVISTDDLATLQSVQLTLGGSLR